MFNFLSYVLAYFKTNNSNNNSNNSGNIINGKRYRGNNITMNNGRVIIDGVDVTGDDSVRVHIETIIFEGNVNTINVGSSNVNVLGMVCGNVKTASGDVTCGDVMSGVSTMSGDVHAKTIKGNVSTMSGDISR